MDFLINHGASSNNIGEQILALVKSSKSELCIMSPYITENIVVEQLLSTEVDSVKIITKCSVLDFLHSSSDIRILKKLLACSNVELRYYSNLHAKVYLFDKEKAIISSVNLTYSGLSANLEYGVYFEEDVERVMNDFSELWGNAAVITKNMLDKIEQEIASLQEKMIEYNAWISLVKQESLAVIQEHPSPKKDLLYTEEQALQLVRERWSLDDSKSLLLKKTYQILKKYIPQSIRDDVTFRYSNADKDNLACNLQNYRLFLLPKTKHKVVEFILPLKNIADLSSVLSEDRMESLNIWTYKAFEAALVDLSMEEVLHLEAEHWEAYANACMMASLAKKSRSREGNIRMQ